MMIDWKKFKDDAQFKHFFEKKFEVDGHDITIQKASNDIPKSKFKT